MAQDVGVPPASETIAARKSALLAQKIREAQHRFFSRNAWWSNGMGEVGGLALLFASSFWLVSPFFGKADQGTTFAAPIILLLAQALSVVAGIPDSFTIYIILAAALIMFPLVFYFFVRELTGRKLAAFIAASFSMLPITPFLATRMRAGFLAGDGPHIASLTIIPLVALSHLAFLRRGGIYNLILASVLTALVALISPFGALILLIFLVMVTFSEMLLGSGRLKLLRGVLVILFAGGLVAFWYNPAFLQELLQIAQGKDVILTFSKLIPLSLFVVPILATIGFLLFERRPNLQPLFLAVFTIVVFGLIILVGGGIVPSTPVRYLSAFGISLSFLFGVILLWLVDWVRIGVLPIIAILLIMGVGMFLREKVVDITREQERVLGERVHNSGELWLVREQAVGTLSLVGYGITGVTVLTLGILALRVNPKH